MSPVTFSRGCLFAGASLLALLAGVPYGLITTVGNPLPTTRPSVDVLTQPVTDQVIVNALAIATWLVWAQFGLAVAIELRSALGGRDLTARLPFGAASQSLARRLVSAILASGAATAAVTSPVWTGLSGPVQAAAAAYDPMVGTVDPSARAETSTVQPGAAEKVARCRLYVVERRDTLWEIAERCLGDSLRYNEIFELNEGIEQPDGRRLTDADWIHPGWILALPADAEPIELTAAGDETYTVRPGDTLWEIADTALGDPTRFGEIFELSRRLRQPDGRALTDPDLIYPGWLLRIPPYDIDGASPDDQVPTRPTAEAPTSAPSATPADPPAPAAPSVAPPLAPPAEQPLAHEPGANVVDRGPSALAVVGYGSLLAAGALAALGVKRTLQQRRRHPGGRIRLAPPPASGPERMMRAVEDPLGVEYIDRALRTLARSCGEAGRPLPALRALRLTPEAIEMTLDSGFIESVLDEPGQAVGPFQAVGADGLFQCPADSQSLVSPAEARSIPAPYPALATIGTQADGSHVLLDLECVGVVTLVGPRLRAVEVLRALAVELACSRLADDMDICLVGFGGALAGALSGDRLRLADTLEEAVSELERWSAEVTATLQHSGASSIPMGRAAGVGEGTWTPRIVLAAEPLSPDLAERVRRLRAVPPRASVAAVVAIQGEPGEGACVLDCGTARPIRLPATDWDIVMQRLGDEDHGSLVEMLRLANDTTSAPIDPVNETAGDEGVDPGLAAGPRVLVLGAVTVEGAVGDVGERRASLTELAAYLALNRNAGAHALAEALWPGRRMEAQTRNSQMSRLRRWLGRDAGGSLHVPLVEGEGYTLAPTVRCDWQLFRAYVRRGLRDDGPDGTASLQAALALIRGQPFSGASPRRYGWAEYAKQEMISTIVDTAHELATRCLRSRDPDAARLAASKGLLAAPECELLWRDLMRAEHLAHNRTGVQVAIDRLATLNEDLGVEMEPETIELASELIGAKRPRR